MISTARKRRCPPRVRMAEILPALAQRVTVLGLTRNISATSDGVRRASGSVRSCIAFPLLTELGHVAEPRGGSRCPLRPQGTTPYRSGSIARVCHFHIARKD